MNDKTVVKDAEIVDKVDLSQGEMDELKREMRSAQWADWAQNNQKHILIGLALVVLLLIGGGLWQERVKSQHGAAATLYQQALNEQSDSKKSALLQSVVSQFDSSSYAALALMQLARLDGEHAEAHLQALMAHPAAMKEWVWQARLDLAALKIEQGDTVAAGALLAKTVGKHYQQLRHYLMAQAADDAAQKQAHLQKALDALSDDDALKRRIETLMAQHAS